jgi:hypothetical protein
VLPEQDQSLPAAVHDSPLPALGAWESLILFPTFGRRDGTSKTWRLRVHGRAFQSDDGSLKQRALLALMRRYLRVAPDAVAKDRFRERAWPFVADSVRGRRFVLRVGPAQVSAKSMGDGHFHAWLTLPDQALAGHVERSGTGCRFAPCELALPPDDPRAISGRIELIPERGVSVVSDIDDTIKVSEVFHKRELVANTFVREFRAVPGMSALYREWERQGAVFHYVSASPWQLYGGLDGLLRSEQFPRGSMHLRRVRPRLVGNSRLMSAPAGLKRRVTEDLMQTFPERQFVLVGDTGERDPEDYGDLARARAAQVLHVFLRNVTGEGREAARLQRAFAGVAPERWTLFDDASELDTLPP